MKKGFYFSVDLKKISILLFSALLVSSLITAVHYSTLSVATANITEHKPVIIVDAGHGGIDGGTQSADGLLEKDVNLAIALKTGKILSLMGYNVVYTREDDIINYSDDCNTIRQKKIFDTHNRMSLIEKYPDGFFLSIHQNYFTQSKYSGTQVFYSKNNPESRIVAEFIQRAVVSELQRENDRQIKPTGTEIYLLYHSTIPSVMVECGFLSNENEAELLSDETYQREVSLAIAKGLAQYLENKIEL